MKSGIHLWLWALLLSGCVTEADRQLEKELSDACASRHGSPAEFRAAYVRSAYGQLLRAELLGKSSGSREELRGELRKLRDEIRLGRSWNASPPEVRLPRLSSPVEIDGKLDDAAWGEALEFRGEYPLNSTVREHPESRWLIGYDDRFLYWAAEFRDDAVATDPVRPYRGDSLELFLLPEPRLRTYLEIVLAPGEPPYAKWVHAGRDGVFELSDFSPAEFRRATERFPGGYRVEAAIAFRELPGYLLGNAPRPGETLFFMPVRTDRDGDALRTAAPVPFLYDGHNIHGYMKGTLQ